MGRIEDQGAIICFDDATGAADDAIVQSQAIAASHMNHHRGAATTGECHIIAQRTTEGQHCGSLVECQCEQARGAVVASGGAKVVGEATAGNQGQCVGIHVSKQIGQCGTAGAEQTHVGGCRDGCQSGGGGATVQFGGLVQRTNRLGHRVKGGKAGTGTRG